MTLTELPQGQVRRDIQTAIALGTQLAPGHVVAEPQADGARGIQSSSSGQTTRDPQAGAAAAGSNFPADHRLFDTQALDVGGDSASTGVIQGHRDAHLPSAHPGGFLRDPVLGLLAEVVDDLESVRIANANRVRILTRTETDSDGEERGFGLTADHPEVAKLLATVDVMKASEVDAIKNLENAMKKHPLGKFVKATPGLGLKQTARLLAAIGDPYWNDLYDRPRTVSELWAYCGFHVIKTSSSGHQLAEAQSRRAAAGIKPHPDGHPSGDTQGTSAAGVAPKRTRGQKSNWSETARKRTWVIASAIPKFKTSPYEPIYRTAREKYADTVHPMPCVRCGPAGKPAPAGSPRSAGHQNAMAIRIVAKEILKDLWIQSKDIYESEANS